MVRAHYPKVRHYRIPDDALIRILEYLDPRSLFLVGKAFKRVYALTMTYHTLRYNIELAVAGMRDGSTLLQYAPILARLHLLSSYRLDWPQLNWTHEFKIQAPGPAHIGVSGGFIHQIRPHGVYNTVEITELPSCRTGRTPALTRHRSFPTPPFETMAIDSMQGLMIGVHIFCQNGIIGVQIHIRDLWTSGKHPRAAAESYELATQSLVPVAEASLVIQGKKIALTLEFADGKTSHLFMDWRNLGARWIDDQDILMLDSDLLLVISNQGGHTPMLSLFNISYLARMSLIRQFELPPHWVPSSVKFAGNKAARTAVPGSLFYPDPTNRVMVIEAKSITSKSASWLFINEVYFSTAPYRRRESHVVPWSLWGQYSAIKDFSRSKKSANIRGPYPVGSRVVYLDSERSHRGALNVIEFEPFPEKAPRLDSSWSVVGPRSGLFPSENSRRLPSATVESYGVDELGVTEDNIVLFLEPQADFQPLNVLTFGAPKMK
ncbi:F-box domain-containing protein [Mycena indigotica]|uniref:F-box domain-containing protein n=1 Tax=Mycena indigotica TaxID=2126181 RepID=A0A8H6T3W9_9AGAR|nr:F-box domain-containing protein [Mycena indigotica]KAF7309877.1 F-box domain-containing protein [Mycena indigotica]